MIPVARTRKNKHATKEPFLDPVTKVIAPAGVKFDYPLEPLKTGKSCTVRGLRLAGSNVSDFFFGADMHPLRREHRPRRDSKSSSNKKGRKRHCRDGETNRNESQKLHWYSRASRITSAPLKMSEGNPSWASESPPRRTSSSQGTGSARKASSPPAKTGDEVADRTAVVAAQLKRIYRKAVLPVEKRYKYDYFYESPFLSDVEFDGMF